MFFVPKRLFYKNNNMEKGQNTPENDSKQVVALEQVSLDTLNAASHLLTAFEHEIHRQNLVPSVFALGESPVDRFHLVQALSDDLDARLLRAPACMYPHQADLFKPVDEFIDQIVASVKRGERFCLALENVSHPAQITHFLCNIQAETGASSLSRIFATGYLAITGSPQELTPERIAHYAPSLLPESMLVPQLSGLQRKSLFTSVPEVGTESPHLDELVNISEGMSRFQIMKVLEATRLRAAAHGIPCDGASLLDELCAFWSGPSKRSPSRSSDMLRRVIAIHEAGHFITKLHFAIEQANGDVHRALSLLTVVKISTDAMASGSRLGYVMSLKATNTPDTMEALSQKVCALYGGMANEEIFFGEKGVSSGAKDDIAEATRILNTMFFELGYKSGTKLNLADALPISAGSAANRLQDAHNYSEQLYRETVAILEKYRPLSQVIMIELIERYELKKNQLDNLVLNYFFQRGKMPDPT